ncbi:hypothetical protein DFJ63DRAFT_336013 [Scheffersomyces coipomensis]|uniref:uncharacterized protein n=1 Tax=Scheffersomyces coipomensis TaxID=1788519 RepID=UPI00315D511B
MNKEQLKGLSHDDLINKYIALETEFIEFQDSSRDLENILESELKAVEQSNQQLQSSIDQAQEKIIQLESIIATLREKSVANEISTDEYQLNERILKQDLNRYQELNNTYLEKIAILDNDYELERQQYQLENNQLQKRVLELEKEIVKAKRRSYYFNTTLSSVSDGFEEEVTEGDDTLQDQENKTIISLKPDETIDEVGNVSVISIREALRSGPPLSKSISNLNLHLNKDTSKRRRSLLGKSK